MASLQDLLEKLPKDDNGFFVTYRMLSSLHNGDYAQIKSMKTPIDGKCVEVHLDHVDPNQKFYIAYEKEHLETSLYESFVK